MDELEILGFSPFLFTGQQSAKKAKLHKTTAITLEAFVSPSCH